MTDTPTVIWTGSSGQAYTYYIHDLAFDPKPGQNGNYIFARQTRSGWDAVYIGQGDLKDRKRAAIAEDDVVAKGATHFHCRLNDDKERRLVEESDLLAGNPEAYAPMGCNLRMGG